MSQRNSAAAPLATEQREPTKAFLWIYVLAYFGGWLGILGPAILALYTRLADLPAGRPGHDRGLRARGGLRRRGRGGHLGQPLHRAPE